MTVTPNIITIIVVIVIVIIKTMSLGPYPKRITLTALLVLTSFVPPRQKYSGQLNSFTSMNYCQNKKGDLLIF